MSINTQTSRPIAADRDADATLRAAIITPTLPDESAVDAKSGVANQTYDNFEHRIQADPRPMSVVRNELANEADADIYVFLDADASPVKTWLEKLVDGFRDGALAVGGPAIPEYDDRALAGRVPDGWDWLVGGGPYHDDERWVRNTYGCNFAMRAGVFDALDGFDEELGKGAAVPQSEETDLAKRMYEEFDERMLYRPDAIVQHRVEPGDVTREALLRRSYNQGLAKAVVGVDGEERGAVYETLASVSPWKFALLAAAGFGYLGGVMRHD